MKHCAKKLLGLAFALALCLAVGGTALAQTPEFADVPAALPEQEMLDYEPNVTIAEDTTTIGDIATNGYQVTIPTTVTVESGENKGELEVNAKLKQYRTLNIGIESPNNWKLKYDAKGAAIANAPTVEYTLKNKIEAGGEHTPGGMWHYDESTHEIMYATSAVTDFHTATIPLSVNVTDPSQATMSGTYSDTLTFTFDLVKQCVTYTINVYEQKLEINNRNNTPHVTATNRVDDATGQLTDANSKPKETYVLEYGCANAWGMPLETAVTSEVWTRPRPDGTEGEEDTRCWEDLLRTLTPKADFEANHKNQTINLNLVRKWYVLDVNGATDYAGGDQDINGNQGGRIGGYVNIKVSADNGATWSDWFWYNDGDDYWGTFPYGINFKLGLHHVKNGYVYDTGTGTLEGNGVKIIANKQEETAHKHEEGSTTYYVYEGTLTGEPIDKNMQSPGGIIHAGGAGKKYQRYCYIPCYKKGITYFANEGTGGTESVNEDNPPRSNVPYDENGKLKTPDDLKINAPAGKSFAGWSTSADYPTTGELYKPGSPVSNVVWDGTYEGKLLSERPNYHGVQDTQKRELYAIWGYDITVHFEDEKGYSTNDGKGPVATLGGTMVGYSFTLEKQVVADGADWTLDLTDPKVTEAIDNATTEAKRAAGDNRATTTSDDVWKTDIEYKLSAAEVKNGKPLVIKRRRYLLSVISALTDTGSVLKVGKNPEIDEYGTFKIIVNGGSIPHLSNNDTSFYQQGLNYGASYTVSDPKPLNDTFVYSDYVILQSLAAGNKLGSEVTQDNIEKTTSYSSHVTGKKNNVHYYKPGDLDPEPVYTGDPVRVAFWEKTTTATPGPNRAPAKKALTLHYHANFDPMEEVALDLDPNPLLDDMDDPFGFDPDPLPEDVDDALEEAVKTVRYQPGEDVVLRHCMFKRGGYVFVGWNTEPDGTGKKYEVNGVPITDWAAGDTVDLYAQWEKPHHLKPVVDSEPFVPADPDTPPERVDDGFDADFGADPDPLPGGMDDAFGVDPDPLPEGMDDAFGIDPDPLPEALDDAFGV